MASRVPVEAPDGTAARPLTPDSSSTSASTVGLPRESRISRATISTMELICFFPFDGLFRLPAPLCHQLAFRKSAGLHQFIERLQRLEQSLHFVERPCVGSVGERFLGVRMRLHEHPCHTGCDSGSRQYPHEFALTTAHSPLPTGELYRMRRIKHHRAACFSHDRQ